jgi:multimeric flavodoxin WrbA
VGGEKRTDNRYGRAPAQVSAFFDKTGGLWASGGLVGKFVSVFTSVAGQHGGHEVSSALHHDAKSPSSTLWNGVLGWR